MCLLDLSTSRPLDSSTTRLLDYSTTQGLFRGLSGRRLHGPNRDGLIFVARVDLRRGNHHPEAHLHRLPSLSGSNKFPPTLDLTGRRLAINNVPEHVAVVIGELDLRERIVRLSNISGVRQILDFTRVRVENERHAVVELGLSRQADEPDKGLRRVGAHSKKALPLHVVDWVPRSVRQGDYPSGRLGRGRARDRSDLNTSRPPRRPRVLFGFTFSLFVLLLLAVP